MASRVSDQERISNLKTTAVSAILAGIGLVGFIVVALTIKHDTPFWYPFWTSLCSLALTTGALGSLWELVGRRNLVREVLHHVDLAEEVVDVGITQVLEDVSRAPWTELITSSKTIKVHLAYGSSWFSNNSASLRKFAEAKGHELQVFLPDPGNDLIVDSLASRFERDAEVIRERIWEAVTEVRRISKTGKGTIQIYFRSGQPTHSFYKFDEKYVIVLYPHTGIRTTLTPFLLLQKGAFAKFVETDFEALPAKSREVDSNELAPSQRTAPASLSSDGS